MQVEGAWLQSRIREEFEKLREFLQKEEQATLDAMTNEARQKQLLADQKMKRLEEETEMLAHEIERLQAEMKEDDISFLMVRYSASGFRDGTRCSGTRHKTWHQSGQPRAPWLPSTWPGRAKLIRS